MAEKKTTLKVSFESYCVRLEQFLAENLKFANKCVAKVALIKAICKLRDTASQTSGDSNNTLYHRVDHPPQTGTSFE